MMLREVQLGGYLSHPRRCSKFQQELVLLYPKIAMILWPLRGYRHRVGSNGGIFGFLLVLLFLHVSKSPWALADALESLCLHLLPALDRLVNMRSP